MPALASHSWRAARACVKLQRRRRGAGRWLSNRRRNRLSTGLLKGSPSSAAPRRLAAGMQNIVGVLQSRHVASARRCVQSAIIVATGFYQMQTREIDMLKRKNERVEKRQSRGGGMANDGNRPERRRKISGLSNHRAGRPNESYLRGVENAGGARAPALILAQRR